MYPNGLQWLVALVNPHYSLLLISKKKIWNFFETDNIINFICRNNNSSNDNNATICIGSSGEHMVHK